MLSGESPLLSYNPFKALLSYLVRECVRAVALEAGERPEAPVIAFMKQAPGRRFANYRPASETEHRTAEEINWRKTNSLAAGGLLIALLTMLFAGAAAIFAKRAADTGDKQLALAKDQEVKQLRSYIDVLPTDVTHINAGDRPEITLFVANYGQTPALRVSDETKFRVEPFPLPPGFKAPIIAMQPAPINYTKTVFATQPGRNTAVAQGFLSTDQAAAIKSSQNQRLYIFGVAEGSDVFGGLETRLFCFSFDLTKPPPRYEATECPDEYNLDNYTPPSKSR